MTYPYDEEDDTEDGPPFDYPDVQSLRNWRKMTAEYQVAERRNMIRWGAVLCRCRKWYDRDGYGPPQADCPIHGVLALDPFTGEVI